MINPGKRWMIPAVCLMAMSLTGCGKEAVHFNNNLTKLDDKLEPLMVALMNHYLNFMKTKSFDAAKAEADHAAMLGAIDANVKEVQGLPVPELKMAREFHTAYLNYYAAMRLVVTEQLRDGLDAMKNPALPEEEKLRLCNTKLTAAGTRSSAATAALTTMQQQYAQANNMKLKSAEPQ